MPTILNKKFNANFILKKFLRQDVLRLEYALALFLGSVVIGSSWFYFMESFTATEAIFMSVITISTVGFGEIHPLSPAGQIFTSGYILLNITIYAYTISAFTRFVVEGDYFKKLHDQQMEKKIELLEGHIIVCGFGRYGHEIIEHFIRHEQEFVVIEKDQELIDEMHEDYEDALYIMGDATHDDILLKAGILKASALISAMGGDTENVFTVLSAKQLNKKLNIISRAFDEKSVDKLKLAGANHVTMPEQIGGFFMATLVTKPNAVEFFSHMTDERASDLGFEELRYEDLPDHCKDLSIVELSLRDKTQTNIIAYISPQGEYMINPSPDTTLVEDSSFIVLGSEEQLDVFRKHFNLRTR